MSKRVQMIPLLVLIVCSGISLSSGLYYDDINEVGYVVHVLVMSTGYYLVRYLSREMTRRELISLGVSLASLVIFFILLYPVTKPGIHDMLNTISTKIQLSYGIDLGKWSHPDSDPVGLVICQMLAFCTVFSLYFYEKKCPVVITVLPSFLLFIISVIADGVPYEMCFIVYGAALIIFLGMGRHGGNVKKLVLLVFCTTVAGLLFVTVFSWNDVDFFMRGYRDKLIVSKRQTPPKRQKEKDKTPEREKQTINFGQFSWEGDITYTGTVELYLHTDKKFDREALFLRGFIGISFVDNTWYGDYTLNKDDSQGNAFAREKDVSVENAYDKGTYIAYSTNKEYYERLMDMSCRIEKKNINLDKVSPETREIDEDLKDQIEKYVLQFDEFDTVGEAVKFVEDYFSVGYKYTLHPGEVLYGEDEVEKFLFERRTGYCTHFASAAIMIFRTVGIPARLAQGYMVSGNRISPDEITSVYDSNAHAWVEIYVNGEGWVPIDVTPRMNRVAEGQNATDGSEETGETVPGEEVPQPTEDVESGTPEDPDETEEEIEEETKDKKEDKKKKKKEKGYEKEGNVLSEKDKDGRQEGFFLGHGLGDVSTVLKYIAGFVAIDLILLLCLGGYRFRQYARMKRRLTEGDFSKRLLHINDNLEKFWCIFKVEWDYADSGELTESIYRAISKYYVFGNADSASEFRQRIYSYVVSVYKARYGGTSISQEEYDSSLSWFLELLEQIQKRDAGKIWKKVKKCSIVKIIYKKEKRESNG